MTDSKIFDSLILVHQKIDKIREDVSEIKTATATHKVRLAFLEKVVYGAVAFILVSFMIFLTGDRNPTKTAQAQTKQIITQTK